MGSNLSSLSALQLVVLPLSIAILYACAKGIYNVYFHPLAKFPGPEIKGYLQYSICEANVGFLRTRQHFVQLTSNRMSGKSYSDIEHLHRKYGHVVRVAPNDLSFSTAESFQDIYGHASKGRKPMLKGDFYSGVKDMEPSIVAQRDPLKHREVRKHLSHAFSAKALRDQTDIVITYVDMFIEQIKRKGNTSEGIEMCEWFNWLTFDIIGDLAFGQSFGACADGRSHPWVKIICDTTYFGAFAEIHRRLPWTNLLKSYITPKGFREERKRHLKLTHERVIARLESKDNDRSDFFSHLLSEKNPNVTEGFLWTNANTLIVAGSETTATTLAGVTYYVTHDQSKLQRLQHEVRTAFSDPKEINGDSTQHLPYLFGIIEEGLRIFPPVSFPLTRISPGAYVTGSSHFVPPGTTVSTSSYTTAHSEEYWYDPTGFHPERWLPKDHVYYDKVFANDNKDASRPFSLGPRVCLGINLAYVELRITLARLAWEFDWEKVGKEIDWVRDTSIYVLWSKPALQVRFTPRVVPS